MKKVLIVLAIIATSCTENKPDPYKGMSKEAKEAYIKESPQRFMDEVNEILNSKEAQDLLKEAENGMKDLSKNH